MLFRTPHQPPDIFDGHTSGKEDNRNKPFAKVTGRNNCKNAITCWKISTAFWGELFPEGYLLGWIFFHNVAPPKVLLKYTVKCLSYASITVNSFNVQFSIQFFVI